MRRSLLFMSLIFCCLPCNAKKSDYTKWGDYNQFTVPLFSLGLSLYNKDYKSIELLAKSYISTQGITHITKKLVKSERPNGGNHSFPSGHTSSAFTGVNFLYKHYGKAYAIPAFLLASSVGHSRIKGKYHYLADVLAGALLSIGMDELFYRNMKISPLMVKNYQGLRINYAF